MNNIVENVITEIEFKAGLTLARYGLQAELKSIQNYLTKESIDDDLRDACYIVFRAHFIREALKRNDAEDACYNLIMLWGHCAGLLYIILLMLEFGGLTVCFRVTVFDCRMSCY